MQIKLTKEHTGMGALLLAAPKLPLVHFPEAEEMVSPFMGQPGILMEAQAAQHLQALLKDIQCENEITAVSGFRTQKEQEQIWRDSVRENGVAFTKKYVARPGCSEHQTGLAIDLAENKEHIDFIRPHFPYTGIFGRFRERAPYFGFVERYQEGKESITGIGAEPWHFRYVGYPHSVIITERKFALEEYIGFLKDNTEPRHPYNYHTKEADIEILYIPVKSAGTVIFHIPDHAPYLLSGTNEGGVVLSIWKV